MTTYRALHNEAPAYISEMLTPYIPPRTLRSTNTSLLTVPTTHPKHGDRAFSCATPRLWNELPISIKNCPSTSTFKQSVKTYLFNRAYCWCLIVDCLERLRTAEKADVWRYIKCFILLLYYYLFISASKRHTANVGSMLVRRHRLRANIDTILAQCLVPAWICPITSTSNLTEDQILDSGK